MDIGNDLGDSYFSEDFRNPHKLAGSYPNQAESIPDKYVKIAEQRERILESFIAEHAGILPSQIRQVMTQLPNGDVAWHVEKIKQGET